MQSRFTLTQIFFFVLFLGSIALPAAAENPVELTITGPDGLAYPDFRYAGVPGGIPTLPVVARVADFGGIPDDGLDDSEALEKAIASAVEKGGGAVLLGAGVWNLERPVEISHSGIVLRGEGRDNTRIESAFRKFEPGLFEVVRPKAGQPLALDDFLEIQFDPVGMTEVRVLAGGRLVAKRGSDRGRNVEFWFRVSGHLIAETLTGVGKPSRGPVEVEIQIDRAAGSGGSEAGKWISDAQGLQKWKSSVDEVTTTKTVVTVDLQAAKDPSLIGGFPSSPALISYFGKRSSKTWPLAKSAKRGDLSVTLAEAPEGLAVGDVLDFNMPNTERYKAEVLSTVPKGWGVIQWQAVVQKIDGPVVHLNQPLRTDFPVEDEPWVRRTEPVRNCGVENLTILQSTKCLVNTLSFSFAYGCWIRDVHIEKTGRNPYTFGRSKFCEVRDLQVDGAWFGVIDNMGGNTAYVSFDATWDSLLDGAKLTGLRHAPNMQSSASGNVMRRIESVGTDVQWHAYLSAENLVENCRLSSLLSKGGTYGYGAYSCGPDSHVHGPNLQGNVLYACDIESSESGFVHRGGPSAKGWIAAYNRFLIRDQGPALIVQLGLPDFTFIGNVCQTANPEGLWGVPSYRRPGSTPKTFNSEGAAVWINPFNLDGNLKPVYKKLRVTGLRLINNRFYGFKTVWAGDGPPAEDKGNELLPAEPGVDPAAPKPPVPSIFLWQKETHPLPTGGKWPHHPAAVPST